MLASVVEPSLDEHEIDVRPSSTSSTLPPVPRSGALLWVASVRIVRLGLVQDSWSHLRGGSDELTFAQDELDVGNTEPVLRVDYPAGEYGGSNGIGTMQLGVHGANKQRAMVHYEVGFSEGFDFVLGGKLPGAYGGDISTTCSGGRNSEACFSARLMWHEGGLGEVYCYVPMYDGQCDMDGMYCHDDGSPVSVERGTFVYESGAYNTVTEIAIINSTPDTANGVLAIYAGTTLAFERKDMIFRINESVFFTTFDISTFFGGGSDKYAATADCYTQFRNFQFWEGDDASTEEGSTVTASIT
ncbi:hypothetical protein JCM10207_006908 [Rhodosporidiobolus poonsookiae]